MKIIVFFLAYVILLSCSDPQLQGNLFVLEKLNGEDSVRGGHTYYFETDSTYKTIMKNTIGGHSGRYLTLGDTLYLNYLSENELLVTYRFEGDYLTTSTQLDTTYTYTYEMISASEEHVKRFNLKYNEGVRNGLPNGELTIDKNLDISRESQIKLISKVVKKTKGRLRYPDDIRLNEIFISQIKKTPITEIILDESYFGNFKVLQAFEARNALNQYDYEFFRYYVIKNGEDYIVEDQEGYKEVSISKGLENEAYEALQVIVEYIAKNFKGTENNEITSYRYNSDFLDENSNVRSVSVGFSDEVSSLRRSYNLNYNTNIVRLSVLPTDNGFEIIKY